MIGGIQDTLTLGNLLTTLLIGLLGIPTTILAWKSLSSQRSSDESAAFSKAVLQVIVGESKEGEEISMRDMLTEIRDNTAEQSALALIVAHHMSDGHGGRVPFEFTLPVKFRREAERQRGRD